jgi:hypothetical protein
MRVEMHAGKSAHRPVVIQNKTVVFDARYDLRLATAHIAEHNWALHPDKDRLVQAV